MGEMSIGTGVGSGASRAKKAGPGPSRDTPPVVIAPPALSGAGRIGAPVTADLGVWGGSPAPGLVPRWQRDGVDIPGADGARYTPVPADDGTDLRCVVTAANPFGTASAATGTVKVAYAAPVAAGNLFEEIFDLEDGGVGTVDAAPDFTVAGDPGLDGVSWSVSGAGASIDGAGTVSIPTAVPLSAEAVTVTATNSGGFAESVFLVTVEGETAAAPFEAALSPAVAVPGTHVTAVPVHADAGVPTGNETYQWFEDGTEVPGATWPTYVARSSHVSDVALTCRITDPARGTALSSALVVTDAAYPGSGAATDAASRLAQYNALPLSGGTIWCAPGDYAPWNVPARLFTGPVTIRSVDPADPAVFLAVNFTTRSANIVFRDIKVEYRPRASDPSWLTVNSVEGGSEKISWLNCEFLGGPCVNPAERYYYPAAPIEAPGYGVGRLMRIGTGVRDVAFIGCDWHDMSAGLSTRNDGMERITVENCETWHNSGDAYVFWTVAGLRFRRNVVRNARTSQEARDRFDPVIPPAPAADPRDHIDGMQFANSNSPTGNSDVWIGDNIFHSGRPNTPGGQTTEATHTTEDDAWFQSIFLSAEQTTPAERRHRNVTVVNNLVYNAHQWGLRLRAVDGGLIANNTVVRNHAQTNGAPSTRITVEDCTGVVVAKNVAHFIDVVRSPDTVLADNLIIAVAPPGSQTEFVGGLMSGSSMAQLQPVPGGAILAGAYGAAYTSSDLWTGGPAGVTRDFAMDALPFDRFVFDSADNATATVTLRGQGTTGDSIRIRGESPGGNTSWSDGATVDANGDWEATLSVPRAQWDEWYTPAARIGADDATRITGENAFGCGHVVAFMGQSEMAYIFNNNAYNNGQPAAADLSEQNAIFSIVNEGQGGGGRFSPADATWTNAATASKSCVYLANLLAAGAPGRKWHVVDLCVVGTSRRQLVDDGQTGRSWADFEAAVTGAIGGSRATGDNLTEVGHLVECWYTSDGAAADWETDYTPIYTGRTAAGASFALGTATANGTRVDHCLWDLTGAGRGLFGDRTKWTVLGPNPYRPASAVTSYGSIVPSLVNSGLAMKAFHASARFDGIRGHYGPTPNYLIGRWDGATWQDGIHPGVNDIEGTPYHAMHFGVALLNAAGVSLPSPRITAVTMASDGAHADVTVSLPNGGTLTTGRIRRGLPAPTPNPAHRQPAHGFEIRRSGDPWSAASPLGFTATIIDTGTGSGAGRTGKVRVTPTTPFRNGDRIGYLRGGASGLLDYQADNGAKLVLDTLVENVPGLTTANAPYDGIPVEPDNSDDLVLSGAPGAAFTPAWQTPAGAMTMTAAGSAFTFAKTGIRKHAIVITFAPDGAPVNQCLLYASGAFQVYLAGGNRLIVQHVNTFAGGLSFFLDTIPGWATKDFALVINIDTTRAVSQDRCKAVLVDLSDGAEYNAGIGGATNAYALDVDTQAYKNGVINAYAAQNAVPSMPFNGDLERVQTFIGVNVDTASLDWLHVGGVLQDPAGIDAAPAVGGGTLAAPAVGTSVKVLDFSGATLASGVNAGAGPDFTKGGAGAWAAR
jgi:hypothetical protein